VCDPPTPLHYYHDSFGNWCGRLVIPPGKLTLSTAPRCATTVCPTPSLPDAQQIPVENLPDDIILFLLASRYCEIDRMMDLAWSLFKDTPTGWAGCRRSAITSTPPDFRLSICRPRPRARMTCMPSGAACAATSRIWR